MSAEDLGNLMSPELFLEPDHPAVRAVRRIQPDPELAALNLASARLMVRLGRWLLRVRAEEGAEAEEEAARSPEVQRIVGELRRLRAAVKLRSQRRDEN